MTSLPQARTQFRLPKGGFIDRKATLTFTLDGRPFSGLSGDTLASALLASGERVVGTQLQVSPAARSDDCRLRRAECA